MSAREEADILLTQESRPRGESMNDSYMFETNYSVDVEERKQDLQIIQQMNSFQELKVLTRLVIVSSPFWVLGILGLFIPWIFAIIPVYGSEMCLCSFY
jgi:hypothetical protein